MNEDSSEGPKKQISLLKYQLKQLQQNYEKSEKQNKILQQALIQAKSQLSVQKKIHKAQLAASQGADGTTNPMVEIQILKNQLEKIKSDFSIMKSQYESETEIFKKSLIEKDQIISNLSESNLSERISNEIYSFAEYAKTTLKKANEVSENIYQDSSFISRLNDDVSRINDIANSTDDIKKKLTPFFETLRAFNDDFFECHLRPISYSSSKYETEPIISQPNSPLTPKTSGIMSPSSALHESEMNRLKIQNQLFRFQRRLDQEVEIEYKLKGQLSSEHSLIANISAHILSNDKFPQISTNDESFTSQHMNAISSAFENILSRNSILNSELNSLKAAIIDFGKRVSKVTSTDFDSSLLSSSEADSIAFFKILDNGASQLSQITYNFNQIINSLKVENKMDVIQKTIADLYAKSAAYPRLIELKRQYDNLFQENKLLEAKYNDAENELVDQDKNFKETNSQVVQRLEEANKQITELKNEITLLSDEKKRVSIERDISIESNNHIRSLLNNANSEISKLKQSEKQLFALQKEIVPLRISAAQLKETQKELDNLKGIEKYVSMYEKTASELRIAQIKIEDLKLNEKQLTELKNVNSRLRKQVAVLPLYEEAKEKINSQHQQLIKLANENLRLKDAEEEARRNADELFKVNLKLAKYQSLVKEDQYLHSENDELKKTIRELTQNLNETKIYADSLSTELNRSKLENESLENSHQEKIASLASSSEELRQKTNENTILQQGLLKATKELEKQSRQYAELVTLYETSSDTLCKANEIIKSLKNHLQESESNSTINASKILSLKESLNKAQRKCMKLESELKTFDLEAQKKDAKIHKLQEEKAKIEKERREQKGKLIGMGESISTLEDRCNHLTGVLKTRNYNNQQSNEKLKKTNTALQEEANNLRKRVKKAEEKIEELSSLSLSEVISREKLNQISSVIQSIHEFLLSVHSSDGRISSSHQPNPILLNDLSGTFEKNQNGLDLEEFSDSIKNFSLEEIDKLEKNVIMVEKQIEEFGVNFSSEQKLDHPTSISDYPIYILFRIKRIISGLKKVFTEQEEFVGS